MFEKIGGRGCFFRGSKIEGGGGCGVVVHGDPNQKSSPPPPQLKRDGLPTATPAYGRGLAVLDIRYSYNYQREAGFTLGCEILS